MRNTAKILWASLLACIMCPLFLSAGENNEIEKVRRIIVEPVYDQHVTFIHRNDDNIDAFFDTDIDSISFSNFDADFNEYPYPVTQYVYAKDSIYVIPLEVVDSISLKLPENRMKKDVLELTYDICNYIVDTDSASITFAINTPKAFLAAEGDLIFTTPKRDIFPDGIAGRVTNITYTGDGYRYDLDLAVSLQDIFDYYNSLGVVETYDYKDDDGTPVTHMRLRSSAPMKDKAKENTIADLFKALASDLKLEITWLGGVSETNTWDPGIKKTFDGLKVKFQVNFKIEDDTELGEFSGSFGPYIRVVVRDVDEVNGNKDLSKVTTGVFIGVQGNINAKLKKDFKIIDPDKFSTPVLDKVGSIPVFGLVWLRLDLIRPLIDVEAALESQFSFEGELGYQMSEIINRNEKAPDDERTKHDQEGTGFQYKLSGDLTITGGIELFIGFNPKIELFIMSRNVCMLELAGKIGVKGSGKLSGSTADFKNLPDPKWDYDELWNNTSYYHDRLHNTSVNGIYFAPYWEIGLTLKVLKGFFGEISIFKTDGEFATTKDLPIIGRWLPEQQLKFDMPLAPDFSYPTVEMVDYDATRGTYRYKVSYKVSGITLMGGFYGLEVIDMDNKYQQNVQPHNYTSNVPGWTFIKEEPYFMVDLKPNTTYTLCPTWGISKGYSLCDPTYVFYATPQVITGRDVNFDPHAMVIVDNTAVGYTDPNETIGIAYIDAGQANTQSANEIDFNKVEPSLLNFVIASDEERTGYASGHHSHYKATIKNLQPGHKYFYTAFYSKRSTDLFMDYDSGRRIDSYGKTKSFTVEGVGFTVYNQSKCQAGEDWFEARGGVEWNDNDKSIDKSKIHIGLEYRISGNTDWEPAKLADAIPVRNGAYFKVRVGNLIRHCKYEYRFVVTYMDNRMIETYSPVVETETKPNTGTFDPNRPIITKLEGQLVATSATSATFRVMADWINIDDADPDEYLPDVADIGIIQCRRKAKRSFPKHDADYMLVSTKHHHTSYKGYRNGEPDDYTYAPKRGEWVEITINGLQPEDKDWVYYWRPYLVLSNTAVESVYNEFNFDAFDEWMDGSDRAWGVTYGLIEKFNTRGKKDTTPTWDFTSDLFLSDGAVVYGAKLDGVMAAKKVGFVIARNEKDYIEGINVQFINGKVKSVQKNSPAHLQRALSRANGELDFGNSQVDDNDNEGVVYDCLLMLDDENSPFKNLEDYFVRAFIEFDDRKTYSNKLKYQYIPTIDDDLNIEVGEDELPEQWLHNQPGEPVDLGLPSGLKWCSTNIGASEIYDYGKYFAWGEMVDKGTYTPESYDFPFENQHPANAHTLFDSDYDIAAKVMGPGWFIPTKAMVQELVDKCEWTFTSVNGVKGYFVKGPNGNAIFLPAGGTMYDKTVYSNGVGGCYWAADCDEFEKQPGDNNEYGFDMSDEVYNRFVSQREAWRLHFHKTSKEDKGDISVEKGNCYYGRLVRAATYNKPK